jgi:hypothetical protein
MAPAATEPPAREEDFGGTGREQETSTREVRTGVAEEFEGALRSEPPPPPVIAQATPRPAVEVDREDLALSTSSFSPEKPPPPAGAPAVPSAPPPPPASTESWESERVAREETFRTGAHEDAGEGAAAKVSEETAVAAVATRRSVGEAVESTIVLREEAPAEPERDHATSWGTIRGHLERGVLPPPEIVDLDELISRFDYGDRLPRRSGSVSLFVEGGAARVDPIRRKMVRVGIRSVAELGEPAATRAMLLVDFDPDVVALYRRIGTDAERRPGEEPELIEIGEIGSDTARSWLFAVYLLPDTRLDQEVATARLSYVPPRGDVPLQIVHNLNIGHVGRHTSSQSVRTAALAGAWAELLAGIRPEISLADLTREAEDLGRLGGESAELARLVLDTVRIIGRR